MLSLDSKDFALVLTVAIPQLTLIVIALINRKATLKTQEAVKVVSDKLVEVHDQVNSKMTQLIATTKEAATAVGKEQGRVEGQKTERQEVKEREG